MSEYDDFDSEAESGEPTVEASDAESPEAKIARLEKLAETLKKENHEYRFERRKAALETEFGSEITEAVVELELPPEKWKAAATKLQSLRGPLVEEPAAEPEPEAEAAPENVALADALGSPTSGTSGPVDVSAKDILEIGKQNPAEAARLIRAKYSNQ